MSLKITENEITLFLKKGDLETVLEELNDCRDLISEYVKIDGDKAIYNYHQIKMLDPEKVFFKHVPEFVLPRNTIYQMVASLCVVLVSIPLILYSFGLQNIWLYVGLLLFSLIFFAMYGVITYLTARNKHIERYQKATYLMAKLLSFFYLTVFQLNNNCNTDLERKDVETKKILEEARYQIRQLNIPTDDRDCLINLLNGIKETKNSEIPKHFS